MAYISRAKRKRVVVNMEKKLEAIQRMDNGESLKSISLEYGVGDSTVSDWKKNRKQIEAYCNRMACKEALRDRKVVSRSRNDALDEALLQWLNKEQERGFVITGPLIQEKALSIHKQMGGDDVFMASPGWLDRFKKRNGIRNFGQGLDTASRKLFGSTTHLCTLLEGLTPEQVYTCGQLVFKYKSLPGGQHDCSDKLSIMLCCNAAGTHKLIPIVTGETSEDVKYKPDIISFRNQRALWMSEEELSEWFHNDFVSCVKFHLEKEQLPEIARLLLDFSVRRLSLSKGELKALPFTDSVSSSIQPMQMGILYHMLVQCRIKLLSLLLNRHRNITGTLKDLLDSLKMEDVLCACSSAWEQIPSSVLTEAWKPCWKINNDSNDSTKVETPECVGVDVKAIMEMLHQLPDCEDVNEQDISEWLEVICLQKETMSDTSEKEETPDVPLVSHEDGVKFLELALMYVEQQPTSMVADKNVLKRLRDQAAKQRDLLHTQELKGDCKRRNCRISGPT